MHARIQLRNFGDNLGRARQMLKAVAHDPLFAQHMHAPAPEKAAVFIGPDQPGRGKAMMRQVPCAGHSRAKALPLGNNF